MNIHRLPQRLPLLTLVACVTVCLSSLSGAGGTSSASAPARDERPVPDPVGATLEQMHSTPADWVGKRVRFVFQFHDSPAVWDPALTRFGTHDYRAVLAWSDSQWPWRLEHYEDPRALLFARRGGPAAAVVARAPEHSRYEAVGRVVQVFLGRPWIELESLDRLPEEIGQGAILHASRALASIEAGAWKLALEDISRAEASNLPAQARAELQRLRETCEAALAARKLPGLGSARPTRG